MVVKSTGYMNPISIVNRLNEVMGGFNNLLDSNENTYHDFSGPGPTQLYLKYNLVQGNIFSKSVMNIRTKFQAIPRPPSQSGGLSFYYIVKSLGKAEVDVVTTGLHNTEPLQTTTVTTKLTQLNSFFDGVIGVPVLYMMIDARVYTCQINVTYVEGIISQFSNSSTLPPTTDMGENFNINLTADYSIYTNEEVVFKYSLPDSFKIAHVNFNQMDTSIFEYITHDSVNKEFKFKLKTTFVQGYWNSINTEYSNQLKILLTLTSAGNINNQEGNYLTISQEDTKTNTSIKLPEIVWDGIIGYKGKKFQTRQSSKWILFDDSSTVFNYTGEKVSTINKSEWWGQTPNNYIGVIPTEHMPLVAGLDYSFENPVVSRTYQNRTAMGKTGDFQRDLGLVIIGSKKIANTIEGMCAADMAFPVDLSHGRVMTSQLDPFIHKGWAVFEKFKPTSLNNIENEYDITLHYLTKELEVPVFIANLGRGNINYLTGSFPDTVLKPSDDLKNYFNVGGDYTSLTNNNLILNQDQDIHFRGKNSIGQPYNLTMEWASTIGLNPDLIERNIIIKDRFDFEIYRYSLHSFNEQTGACKVTTTCGTNVTEETIYLKLTTTQPTQQSDDLYQVNGDILTYGSTTNINIRNGVISIFEEGWTDSEFYTEEIIYSNDYVIELQTIVNGNAKTTTAYKFTIDETFLIQDKNMSYNNLVVSSIPVKDKVVLFTRRSADGLLYYYEQDEDTFKYGTNPLIRWKGGVDVTTIDGTSLLNTEFSIDPISMNNCLIKLDFSKKLRYIKLYLFSNNTWNLVCKFRLEKMDITKAHTIDFDKSIMESNNNLFTLKRGHFFVEIAHPDDDLLFDYLFDYYLQNQGGMFKKVKINSRVDDIDFNKFFYVKLENESSDVGLMVVKADFTNISMNSIPKSTKTVLIPYNKKATGFNTPENLLFEWMNHIEQQTIIVG